MGSGGNDSDSCGVFTSEVPIVQVESTGQIPPLQPALFPKCLEGREPLGNQWRGCEVPGSESVVPWDTDLIFLASILSAASLLSSGVRRTPVQSPFCLLLARHSRGAFLISCPHFPFLIREMRVPASEWSRELKYSLGIGPRT
jgi:hypothetical protein